MDQVADDGVQPRVGINAKQNRRVFTDFQLIWALTRGGPANSTHLMATLSYQRGILSGRLGEGAAIATAMIPFLLAAITISWFGMQRRKWQQGSDND